MVVGEVATRTEVLVIGGGPGGYAAAIRAAQMGKQVTLVERDRVGGTCLNVGCIPSKVLIHAAELAHLPTATADTGITLQATVDLAGVQAHLHSVVGDLTGGVSHLLDAAGVEVVTGTARFSRAGRVAVLSAADEPGGVGELRHIEFGDVILATGSRPIELPNLPFTDERIVDSTGALFGFTEIPESLVVVGGGYIGIELGTAWAKLGSQVTIVEAQPTVLPELDPRLGRVVKRRLGQLGVAIECNAMAMDLGDAGLRVARRDDETTMAADAVIVCVGRRPNTDDLGLDVLGITPRDDGLLDVDAQRRVGPGVLAIGDITPGPALAHKATAEAEVAARTVAGQTATFDPACIPAVVFSDPEVATVGMTMAHAKAAGAEVSGFVFPISASGRAKSLGANVGHIELVADTEGTLLGAHIAGPHASELIGGLALAIEMATALEEVAATIFPHPTMSEGILEAAHGALGLPLHIASSR